MLARARVSAAGFIWSMKGQTSAAAPPMVAMPAAMWMKSRRVGTCSAASWPVITSLGAPSAAGRSVTLGTSDELAARIRMRLGLFQPDIPQNLGAAIRLAACLDVGLDVIEPCAFPLSD